MCKPSPGWQRSLKRESHDFSRGRFNKPATQPQDRLRCRGSFRSGPRQFLNFLILHTTCFTALSMLEAGRFSSRLPRTHRALGSTHWLPQRVQAGLAPVAPDATASRPAVHKSRLPLDS